MKKILIKGLNESIKQIKKDLDLNINKKKINKYKSNIKCLMEYDGE